MIITDLPSVRPETIAAARRCITRQATRAGWTPADITDVHTILGIDEPALPTLAVEPAQQPEPAIPKPNPAPEPVAPVWFDALDVIAESGSTRNFVDYLVKSGHLIVAASRTPSGTIAPAHGRGHGTRLFTRGEVAIACRIAHLNTAWRRSGAGMTLSDLTQIARAGHASDLPLGLLRSVDWLTVAAKARDAAATRPGWLIWREALLDLSGRALTVHVDTTPGEGSAE